jgi:hypothetical protein
LIALITQHGIKLEFSAKEPVKNQSQSQRMELAAPKMTRKKMPKKRVKVTSKWPPIDVRAGVQEVHLARNSNRKKAKGSADLITKASQFGNVVIKW